MPNHITAQPHLAAIPPNNGENQKNTRLELASSVINVSSLSNIKAKTDVVDSLFNLAVSQLIPAPESVNAKEIKRANMIGAIAIHSYSLPKKSFDTLTQKICDFIKYKDDPLAAFDLRLKLINNGANFSTIVSAIKNPISRSDYLTLKNLATKGPAGEEIRNGENCIAIAEKYGIGRNSEAFHVLENIVTKGPARDEIRNGGNCIAIAEKYGIDHNSPQL